MSTENIVQNSTKVKKEHFTEIKNNIDTLITDTKLVSSVSSPIINTTNYIKKVDMKQLIDACNLLETKFNNNCCQANCCQGCQTAGNQSCETISNQAKANQSQSCQSNQNNLNNKAASCSCG